MTNVLTCRPYIQNEMEMIYKSDESEVGSVSLMAFFNASTLVSNCYGVIIRGISQRHMTHDDKKYELLQRTTSVILRNSARTNASHRSWSSPHFRCIPFALCHMMAEKHQMYTQVVTYLRIMYTKSSKSVPNRNHAIKSFN